MMTSGYVMVGPDIWCIVSAAFGDVERDSSKML